jgi:hypothetical protein
MLNTIFRAVCSRTGIAVAATATFFYFASQLASLIQ